MENARMNVFNGKFGPLAIQIKGNGELFNRFCDEITPISINEEHDLKVIITSSKSAFSDFNPEYSSAKQHMSFNEESFFYDEPVPFLCKNLFNKDTCEVIIKEKTDSSLKSKVKELRSTSINSRAEISYSLFWYIVQVLLLKRNCSFIHAGIFSVDNEAVAFMGTGGSGKTSTMFHYLSKPDYKYLSEDFGIIRDDGYVYLSSKTLSIYSSDIHNETSILNNFMRSMKLSEKIKWRINRKVRKKNPMIKMPVYSFLSQQKISNPTTLSKAFFIVRSDNSEPTITPIETEDLADRLVNVTLREMNKFVELLNLIKANSPIEYPYPSLDMFISMIKGVYLSAFEGKEIYLLNLPFEYSPGKVEEYISMKGLLR